MSIITEFHADGKRFKVITYDWSFNQPIDATGRPSATPQGGIMKILIETEKDEPFTEWAVSPTMMKNVKLVQRSVNLDGKSRIIVLVDVYCIEATDNYSSTGSKNLSTFLVLSPAQILVNDQKMMEKHWKVTDLDAKKFAPTVIEHDEPIFAGHHFEDIDGTSIEQNKIKIDDEVYLIIDTENSVGESVTIDLNDPILDYEYNGKRLENDILTNVNVTSDSIKVKLKAIKQEE